MGMVKKLVGFAALKKIIDERRERKRQGGNIGRGPGRGGRGRRNQPIEKGPIYGAR